VHWGEGKKRERERIRFKDMENRTKGYVMKLIGSERGGEKGRETLMMQLPAAELVPTSMPHHPRRQAALEGSRRPAP